MLERDLIDLKQKDVDSYGDKNPIKKKKKSFYRSRALYVECQFDTTLLPMKLNLPMVYPPTDWSYDYSQVKEKEWFNISYLYGGYLNAPTKEIYDRYRLLSSGDVTN